VHRVGDEAEAGVGVEQGEGGGGERVHGGQLLRYLCYIRRCSRRGVHTQQPNAPTY
jgi:hypothetical protein